MAKEDLGLRLSAEITQWVTNLAKAEKSADGLRLTVVALEKSIRAAFVGIEAIAKQGGLGIGASFLKAATDVDTATGRMEVATKEASASFKTLGTTADASAAAVARASGKIETSVEGIGAATVATGRTSVSALTDLETSFGKVGERIKGGIFNIQNALIGLAAVKLGKEAVGGAVEFETALGQVNIVAADSGKSIEELRGFLLDLSKTTPIGLIDLTKSLGDAIGKLPKGANQAATAIEALNAAQAAARASGSSAEQVLSGIIPILNTYGKTGITAAEITDKLFAAFDQGGATVPQLAASLGDVVSISSQFGISIDELLGEISVLTRGGQTASVAITNLRQAFLSTAKGGAMKDVALQLEAIGLSADLFSSASLKTKGLIGVLEELKKAGGDNVLEKLFTDTQGFLGVSTLLGAGLEQVREDITGIGGAAGKTDAAVAKIANNFDQLAGIAKNRLAVVLIDIGEKILPAVTSVVTRLTDYIVANGDALAEGFKSFVDVVVGLGTFIAEHGESILGFFIAFKAFRFFGGLAGDIANVTTAIRGLGAASEAAAAVALTAKKLIPQIDPATGAAIEAVGVEAGTKLATGFKGAVSGLGGTLKTVFSSPGLIAAAVGAFALGATIGKAIGEGMVDALSATDEAIQKVLQAAISKSTQELTNEIERVLKQAGFETQKQLDEATDRIKSGKSVLLSGSTAVSKDAEGNRQIGFNAGDEVQVKDLFKKAPEQAAEALTNALAATEAGQIESRKLLALNEQQIAETLEARDALQGSLDATRGTLEEFATDLTGDRPAVKRQVAALTSKIDALLVDVRKAEKEVAEADKASATLKKEIATAEGTERTATANAAAATIASPKDAKKAEAAARAGESAAAKAAKRLETINEQIATSDATAAKKRLDNDQAVAEQQDESAKRRLETILEIAKVEGASEQELLKIRTDAFNTAEGQFQERMRLVKEGADFEVKASEAAEQKKLNDFKDSKDAQAAIAASFDQDQRAIRLKADADVNAILQQRAKTSADLLADKVKAAFDALPGAIKKFLGFDESAPAPAPTGPAPKTPEQAASDRLAQLQLEERVITDPIGNIGELSGMAGLPLPPEAQLITKAPAIAGSIADLIGGDVAGLQKQRDAKKSALVQNDIDIAALRMRIAETTNAEDKAFFEQELAKREEAGQKLNAEIDGLRVAIEGARGGIEKWGMELVENVGRLLENLFNNLPQLIERFLKDGLPKLIQIFVRLLIDFTVGLPSLIVKVVIAIARALFSPEFWIGIVTGLIDGFKDAFVDLFGGILEIFTSDIAKAIVGAIVDGFLAVLEFIKGAVSKGGSAAVSGIGDVGGLLGKIPGIGPTLQSGVTKAGGLIEGGLKSLGILHQGGMVNGASNPGAAMALHAAGAQHFADGGMVAPASSLARRRMSQILRGDDIPALLAPGEGVLTAKGVDAAGGPTGVDSLNRGNGGGSQAAQIVLSTQVGGDRALAAMITRIVKVSVMSPHGNVRAGIDQINRATRVPAFAGLKGA